MKTKQREIMVADNDINSQFDSVPSSATTDMLDILAEIIAINIMQIHDTNPGEHANVRD